MNRYDKASKSFEEMRLEEGIGEEDFISDSHWPHESIINWHLKETEELQNKLVSLETKLAKAKDALNYIREIELIGGDVLFHRFDQPLIEKTLAELGE